MLTLTTRNIELILVNDGSSDNTFNIFQANKDKLASIYRVKFIDKKNAGIEYALKDAFKIADGRYIFLMGHDDFLSENALDLALDAFNKDEEIDAVRMDLMYIDENLNLIREIKDNRILSGNQAVLETIGWNIHTFCVWKREIFERISEVNTGGMMNFDEYLTRYFYANCNKVGHCDGKYFYLQHNNSITKKVSLRKLEPIRTDLFQRDFLIAKGLYLKCAPEFEAGCVYTIINGWNILQSYKTLDKIEYAKYYHLVKEGFNALNKEQYLKNINGPKAFLYKILLKNFVVFTRTMFWIEKLKKILT